MGVGVTRILVGTCWITFCNGLFHTVFLADDDAGHFGPCDCQASSPWTALVRELEVAVEPQKNVPPPKD